MRPFVSVGQALKFYRRMAGSLSQARSVTLTPRIQGDDPAGRTEDILAVCLSVAACLRVLDRDEMAAVDKILAEPRRRPEEALARTYHRAMTKLGKEMRRRGVVG